MGKLTHAFSGGLLTLTAAIHLNVYPVPLDNSQILARDTRFQLPSWMMKEIVIDDFSWQNIPMKIEFFTLTKLKEEFLKEIATLIPEGAVMSKTPHGIQIHWINNQISYLLLLDDIPINEFNHFKGVLSSIELSKGDQSISQDPKNCSRRWLPDDVQLIFSMGDKPGGVSRARIDGYRSDLGFNEVRSIIISRLKTYGWIRLAEYPHRSELGISTIFEANCGNQHARIDLQKQSFQTRISVMSITQ